VYQSVPHSGCVSERRPPPLLATDLILLPGHFRCRISCSICALAEELQLGEKKNCNQRNLVENGTQPPSRDESVLTKHIRV
jgi:hypothetical protein